VIIPQLLAASLACGPAIIRLHGGVPSVQPASNLIPQSNQHQTSVGKVSQGCMLAVQLASYCDLSAEM
jgi:hypothetical protein